jgi:hypothetical protein
METLTFRESLAGAIRYWEPRRLIYNAVLAAIVLIYFGINYPATKSLVSIDSVLDLFLLVVLANVAYCAAYLVDLFVSASSYRDQWQNRRWIIFVIGLLFAAIITRFLRLGYSNHTETGCRDATSRRDTGGHIPRKRLFESWPYNVTLISESPSESPSRITLLSFGVVKQKEKYSL